MIRRVQPFRFSLFADVVCWNTERCELEGSGFIIQQCVPKTRAAGSGSFSRYPLTNEIV